MVQEVPASRCRSWRFRVAASALMAAAAVPAMAQSGPTDGAPSEAARRQALGPFRMILQNADAARKPAPKKAPHPVAAGPAHVAGGTAATPAAPALSQVPATPSPPVEPGQPEVAAVPASAPAPALAAAPARRAPAAPQPVALVPVQQDAPVLPAALRHEQPQGIVRVGFAVKPDGSTADVQVLSSTNRRLNSASVAAVAGWRFQPIAETRPTEVELVFEHDKD